MLTGFVKQMTVRGFVGPVGTALLFLAVMSTDSRPGLNPRAARAQELPADDQETGFACPMHADYSTEAPGTCPICGMNLVKTAIFDMREYALDFETVPATPRAGEKLTFRLRASHPGTGAVARNFEVVHGQPYHLFIISQDMESFQHIHPVQAGDGTWSIDAVLPKPGYYSVLSDFVPTGGSAQFLARPLVTAGYTGDIISQSAQLSPDRTSTQVVDDLTASVSYDPGRLLAGAYGHLTFHLTKGNTDEPVRDLQTYLGAFGHMLIMSEDMTGYVHSHPVPMPSPELNLEELRGGPDVMFEALMPKEGRYRAWTQFRYQDRIYTFVNTFEVFADVALAP
jgi:hypothetical protein